MKKSTIIIYAVIFSLTAAIVVLGVLHWQSLPKNTGCFVVKTGGAEYSVNEGTLQKIGIVNFTAKKKSSGKPAVDTEYRGVPWLALARELGIDQGSVKRCVATASDGFVSAVPMAKMNQPDNVFIAITEEDGPFLLIIKNDTFSQYWCKHLCEMSFQ